MVSRQKKSPSLEYGEEAAAALEACRTYLEQAVSFLNGRRSKLPDPRRVAETAFPASSIQKVRYEGADGLGADLPFVACVIADDSAPSEVRSERYFDPWYFVAMRLLELPGARFRFDRSKHGKYFYQAYAGPVGKEGNHYLRRIIANTPWWADTREGKTNKSNHYDYRRPTLRWVAKNLVRKLGHKTRSHSRVRDDAVLFAVRLLKRQMRGKQKLPALNIGLREYEALLRMAFEIADGMHEQTLLQRAKRA